MLVRQQPAMDHLPLHLLRVEDLVGAYRVSQFSFDRANWRTLSLHFSSLHFNDNDEYYHTTTDQRGDSSSDITEADADQRTASLRSRQARSIWLGSSGFEVGFGTEASFFLLVHFFQLSSAFVLFR